MLSIAHRFFQLQALVFPPYKPDIAALCYEQAPAPPAATLAVFAESLTTVGILPWTSKQSQDFRLTFT